jgi:hypothetical protein
MIYPDPRKASGEGLHTRGTNVSSAAVHRIPRVKFGARRVGAVVAASLTLAVLSGCTTFTSIPFLAAPPSSDRWSAGDSLAYNWVQYASVPTFNAAHGGNGFIQSTVGTIEEYTLQQLGTYRPTWMIVTSATTDWYFPFADVVVAMEHFEATMNSMGIKVYWVSEPNLINADPSFYPARARINDWQMTRQYHADCGPVGLLGGVEYDQVHLTVLGNQLYAKCLEDQFPVVP